MIKHIFYILIFLILGFVIGFYTKDWSTKGNIKEELSFRKPDIQLNSMQRYNAPISAFPDTICIKKKQKEYSILQGSDEFGPV